MSRFSAILFCVVTVISCSDIKTTSKPFAGPLFDLQLSADTSEWVYDDTLRSFDFYQAREAPSFLYSRLVPGFRLSTLLSIPVHGGGLKIASGDTIAMLQAYPDKVSWQLNNQSGLVPITMEDYPVELGVEVNDMEVQLFMKPKHQSPVSIGEMNIQLDSVDVGLFANGFGGYNFENVQMHRLSGYEDDPGLSCAMEIYDLKSLKTEQVKVSSSLLTHVAWAPDGKHIYYSEEGKLKRLHLESGQTSMLTVVDMSYVMGGSPDPNGERMAITALRNDHTQVYFLPMQGGKPEPKTVFAPSYFSDWSPDGEWLIYSGARKGKQLDIYKLSRRWGREERLTVHDSLDGGAVYGSQYLHIYFHSDRSGSMKIWKMSVDGDGLGQVTHDEDWNDWHPQPSPDGRWLLVYSQQRTRSGEITLRLFDLENLTESPKILLTYFGDVSTPVLNSWSVDSDRIVYVSSIPRL